MVYLDIGAPSIRGRLGKHDLVVLLRLLQTHINFPRFLPIFPVSIPLTVR
jgi:hypothetical protein